MLLRMNSEPFLSIGLQQEKRKRGEKEKRRKRKKKGEKESKKRKKCEKKEGGGWVWGGRGAWVLRRVRPHTNHARST